MNLRQTQNVLLGIPFQIRYIALFILHSLCIQKYFIDRNNAIRETITLRDENYKRLKAKGESKGMKREQIQIKETR